MGAYLSTPVTTKESGSGPNFAYSSMQGWRTDHEDAHICSPNLLPDISLFAVFDGHGGAEVAKFAAEKLPLLFVDAIRESSSEIIPAVVSSALIGCFESFDTELRNPSNFAAVAALKSQKATVSAAAKPEALAMLQASIAADLQALKEKGGAVSREEAGNIMMKMMLLRRYGGESSSEDTPAVSSEGEGSTERTGGLPAAGCTANAVVVTSSHIVCANAGDSRAVLARKDGTVAALSEDHKPNDAIERARIEKAGGWVETIQNGPPGATEAEKGKTRVQYRVNGNLNLSRSLGDLEYKKRDDLKACEQIITATPDVTVVERTGDEEFIVIACDGIWDVKKNEEVVDFVRGKLREGMDLENIAESLMDQCIAKDIKDSGGLGGDNMTVVIVLLGDCGKG